METSEARTLLAKVVAYDRRSVGQADVAAWAEAMTKANIELPDALEAVTAHFAESHNWLMPAHVTVLVRSLERLRVREAQRKTPDIPADLTPPAERAWLAAYWLAVKTGSGDPHGTADSHLGLTRPPVPAAQPTRLLGIMASLPMRSVEPA